MSVILLKSGEHVLVDDEDSDLLSVCWHVQGKSGIAHTYYENGKQKHVLLRRIIAERVYGPLKRTDHVFHKNGIFTDCTRNNLMIGHSMPRLRKSLYKGVRKVQNKWQACIFRNRKRISFGYYDTPEEAAWAYNQEMRKRGYPTQCLNPLDEEKLEKVFAERREQKKKNGKILLRGKQILLSEEDQDLTLFSWHLHCSMGVARRLPDGPERPYVFLKRIIAQRIIGRPLFENEYVTFRESQYDYRRDNLCIAKRNSRKVNQYLAFDNNLYRWFLFLPEGSVYGPFQKREEAIAVFHNERKKDG